MFCVDAVDNFLFYNRKHKGKRINRRLRINSRLNSGRKFQYRTSDKLFCNHESNFFEKKNFKISIEYWDDKMPSITSIDIGISFPVLFLVEWKTRVEWKMKIKVEGKPLTNKTWYCQSVSHVTCDNEV